MSGSVHYGLTSTVTVMGGHKGATTRIESSRNSIDSTVVDIHESCYIVMVNKSGNTDLRIDSSQ